MKCNDPNCHFGVLQNVETSSTQIPSVLGSNRVRRNHAAFQEILFSKMPCIIFIFPHGIIWEKEKLI
jgi:hypothetical protein